jgi:hypothetical protein
LSIGVLARPLKFPNSRPSHFSYALLGHFESADDIPDAKRRHLLMQSASLKVAGPEKTTGDSDAASFLASPSIVHATMEGEPCRAAAAWSCGRDARSAFGGDKLRRPDELPAAGHHDHHG